VDLLQALSQRHTLRTEAGRRVIIHLYILLALEHVEGFERLFMDEETKMFCILDDPKVKYYGSADFTVGHSMEDGR
jgi:hypothetical protein